MIISKITSLFICVILISICCIFYSGCDRGLPLNREILPDFSNYMVLIKGGTFEMGDFNNDGADDEKPVHTVTVSDYYMSAYEVTVGEYKFYCMETGTDMPPAPEWGFPDDHPVVNVNWFDATGFCEWLSEKTGETIRLPYEAEWEYAARDGGQKIAYPAGDDLTPAKANYKQYYVWIENETVAPTKPPGTYPHNSIGLYNLTANVHEWVFDRYHAEYYSVSHEVNPTGPAEGEHRVGRGGSWRSPKEIGRTANRNYSNPAFRIHNMGFRIVMEVK